MSRSNHSPVERRTLFRWHSERLLPYWLLAPAVVVTVVIVFMPMVQAVFTSFYDLILFRPNASKFVGFGNYIKLFNDPVFWTALWNTIIWIGLTVPLQMGLGLVAALLLNREFPWRGLARALIIIPWALPSVVIALMWRWIYDPNTGVLNDILIYLSIVQSAVPWLADPKVAIYAIIATLTWQGFPFFAVMILAGLQGIPRSQYEAASIDGASTWRQFVHITLPGIAPVLATAGLLRVIWVANSMDVIFVMTGGGPGYATHTLPLYAFIKARQNLDFGYGTAIAVTFTILLGAFVVLYLSRTMREVER
ncbi:carbohydrate ABC transporter permease [Neorhizobium galegae]|uniref:carbohydrate ABC transporter permease n=1 Tax=Neorhizobium galegae TaxID=399 RepID=UPI000622A143|nr:sugar ABC transporter permease [Neorhizobium galegae]CDZ60571.1 Binding--dependent transport system inner membrane component family protein [Neorhizobium galegae bv. orientalis]KAB1121754.1 sugar ABC transporter permease [Neorhizobium galegae]MCQ1574757.1 sugar ABC transporter permease [Neorhizobium galegae]MCQ1808007.1 sugar ABC transporter permease [Neorhizobium galegae]MCQ1835058.1 sugar ABC transporter permease [Neorhizobium galegae]